MVPFICPNEKCGHAGFSGLITGSGIVLEDCAVDCPRCGTMCPVPDGMLHAPTQYEFFKREQWMQFAEALESLRNKVRAGASLEEIKKEVDSNPWLEYLRKFVPKDLKDLKTLTEILGWIGGIFTLIAVNGHLDKVPVTRDSEAAVKALMEQIKRDSSDRVLDELQSRLSARAQRRNRPESDNCDK